MSVKKDDTSIRTHNHPQHSEIASDRSEEEMKDSIDLDFMSDEINQTIDDALKISERMREGTSHDVSDDDIDIPTFIRQGIKDLNLD